MINIWFYYQLLLYDGKVDNETVNNEYIKLFWVGLMDGAGSIQVNHWHLKSLQYRLIIKLSNLKSNYNMLLKIAKTIGGIVIIINDKKEVIWVADKKETILEIINILFTYPPLTSRLTCQLKFLKVCLDNNSVKNYLNKRKFKYNEQVNIIRKLNLSVKNTYYFSIWLSGFMEAKGCFWIRANKKHSFSIGHKNDFYLLDNIKKFLDLKVLVKNPQKKFYLIESYNKQSLRKIIKHCINYPLLGAKFLSLNKLIQMNN